MRIMILGAYGYLGWPTSVDLAFKDHELMLVDNYVKRNNPNLILNSCKLSNLWICNVN